MKRYCVTCHNDDLNTANLRLDDVRLEHLTERGDIWEKVVHKLRTNAMPPADSPQLSRGAQSALLGWMVTELDAAAAENPNPGRPATHRLNRSEYTNAIRDLLNLEIDGPDLLPTDGSEYGFDNNADALGISPMLLERYMLAAAKISRQAIGDPKTLPSVQTYDTLKQVTQDERLGDEFSFGTRGGS